MGNTLKIRERRRKGLGVGETERGTVAEREIERHTERPRRDREGERGRKEGRLKVK